ncbi:MAG: DMT family transporter [Deltaproteobacteria bacterium]|nr:DMT family transporter [Deltaproteobacteria bacterium]
MISIQFGASVAKGLFPALGPEGTTALRCGIAALILLALQRPWRARLPPSALLTVGLYGASLGLMNLLFYLSLARIPLGVAVALEFTGPLSVALLSSHRARDLLWVVLAAAGIVLILPLSRSSRPLDPVGVAFALAAGVCWALYIVLGQRAGKAVQGGAATALGMLAAALVVAPIGVLRAGPRLLQSHLWPLALAVAVFSSALPYSLEMHALRRLPARTFGILMSLEPALAALAGLVMLRERLSPAQGAAIACIIAASAGSAWTARPASPPPTVG